MTSTADVQTLRRLLSARFTCRAYTPEPVPEAVIRSIVDVARATPSWCNTQPWDLVVTTGERTDQFRTALMAQVRQHPEPDYDFPSPDAYLGVYQERRRRAGFQLYDALGIDRSDRQRRADQVFENFRLFGAPHVTIVTAPREQGMYGAVDVGGFICAFLLSAQAHGVATTAQAVLARQSSFVRNYFNLAEDRRVVCGISFGYADEAHPVNGYRTERAAVDDFLHLV